MLNRKKTRVVKVRGLSIGGDAPVSIQSMTNVPIENINGTIDQIRRLHNEGADLVRLAVKNEGSISYIKRIREKVHTPLSADIHFNHRIAIKAIEAGIDKIRINPGNIKKRQDLVDIIKAAKEYNVPIRIGVNGGSIDRKKYSSVTTQNLVDSAIQHINILEDNDFFDILVSIKSSDLSQTIEANRVFSTMKDYPLHIGLTEAGFGLNCIVQSSIAIGSLLLQGIGDTIRVSMTGDSVEEIVIARKILESLGMRNPYIRIISCPTCGRTDSSIDILKLASMIEKELKLRFSRILKEMDKTITVAVMGCEVNGPGEASHADVGVAGGKRGRMILFSKGMKQRTLMTKEVVGSLIEEIEIIIENS